MTAPRMFIPLHAVIVIWILCACEGSPDRKDLQDEDISREQIEMMVLRGKVADTAWTRPNSDWPDSKAWFQLKDDGTAIAGWHGLPCLWTVTSGSTIRMLITSTSRELKDVKFDSNMRSAEMRRAFSAWREGTKEQNTLRRIDPSKIEGYLKGRGERLEKESLQKLTY